MPVRRLMMRKSCGWSWRCGTATVRYARRSYTALLEACVSRMRTLSCARFRAQGRDTSARNPFHPRKLALLSDAWLPQFDEKRLRVLQIPGIKTFGEPIVDRIEQVTGFRAFALVAPEPGKAERSAQFPKFCALALRNGKAASKAVLRGRLVSDFS